MGHRSRTSDSGTQRINKIKVTIAQKAGDYFSPGGFCCAESVLKALAEAKEIRSELIPRIATGLCSGMSRTNRTCGALNGAIMGMGLVYGRGTPEDDREYLYALVQELFKRFTEKYGTSNCHELIGCDLNTDEGQKYFVDNNLDPKCREITAEAARIAMEIMEEGV